MPFLFRCPHCATETEVDEQYAGQTGPCAVCGKQVTVPYPGETGVARRSARSNPATAVPMILAVTLIALAGAAAILGLGFLMLRPVVQTARNSAQTTACANNLKQIAAALQAYADVHGSLPPAYIADASGKPMHSWRVLILPYLGHTATYERYDFNQPWDSEQNIALRYEMPIAYSCPTDPDAATSEETNYMVIVGRDTAFPRNGAVRLSDISDGISQTILVVETRDEAVCWLQPRDLDARQLQFQLNAGRGEIGGNHEAGAHVVLADGSVRFLPETAAPEVVRAMTTIAGGELIPWNQLQSP